jgi:polyisoprenoid-binding protein YceI
MPVRSPYLAAIAPLVALLAGLARWILQGSGNLYTASSRRAYVPDPDLGWRVVQGGPPWLGLEVLAVILGITVAIIVGAWIVRRLERGGPHRAILRGILWTVGVGPLAVPAWAFGSGFGPDGARDQLPTGAVSAAPTGAVTGSLDAPAGRWEVVANPGSSVTARVTAGGEGFDARFTGNLRGTWTGDPRDLAAPMSASVTVDAESVDTGVSGRSKSARTTYLHADKYPQLTFRLDRLESAESRDGELAFRAAGSVDVAGTSQDVEISGSLRLLDDAARARLGVADGPAMLATADFPLLISASGIAFAASDFDGDEIPVHVSLILVHREGTSR